MSQVSIISIDDDKVQLRSSMVPQQTGVQLCYQQNQSPGPVFYAAVSATTGLVISLQPSMLNMTKTDMIKTTVADLRNVVVLLMYAKVTYMVL